MQAPSGWKNSFSLFQAVTIAVSGESGHIVGEFINNSYLVRYRTNDGVAVEQIWSADALTANTTAEVIKLRAVQ